MMEKVQATMARNHEPKELPKNNPADRFSNLPECIIHHIFSYLERNYIPRMMCVSRSFKQACMTVPQLDLLAHFVPPGKCFCLNFKKSFRRMLMTEGNAVSHLRLHWYCACYEYFIRVGSFVSSWMQTSVENNLQVLDLRFHPRETFFISSCLVSLKVLRLDLCGGSFWVDPSRFPHLVSLTLTNLEIFETSHGGVFGHELSSINLKRLCLEEVKGVSHISITSSSLEQFTVSRWHTSKKSCSLELESQSLKEVVISFCSFEGGMRISITCPWLQDLTMSYLMFYWSSEIIVSAGRLEALTIYMAYLEGKYALDSPPTIHFSEDMSFLEDAIVNLQAKTIRDPCGYTDAKSFVPWLDRMRLAIALQIPIEVFRYQLPTFHNLQHLVVICWSFRGDEDLLLSPYLIGCLHLRTLTMERDHLSPAVVDDNVVYNMCLRSGKFVTKNGKAKMAVFTFKGSELKINPEKEIARQGIPKCDNTVLEKVMYFY